MNIADYQLQDMIEALSKCYNDPRLGYILGEIEEALLANGWKYSGYGSKRNNKGFLSDESYSQIYWPDHLAKNLTGLEIDPAHPNHIGIIGSNDSAMEFLWIDAANDKMHNERNVVATVLLKNKERVDLHIIGRDIHNILWIDAMHRAIAILDKYDLM